MNIFYFLDSLCDACLAIRLDDTSKRSYIDLLARDLGKIVECAVPEGRAGLPNFTSVKGVCVYPTGSSAIL
jgi:hypothetical protein